MNVLKANSLANIVTSIVRHESSFVAVVKSIMDFSAAIWKEHNVSFLTA